jgi:hypothetical protein
MQRTRCLAIAGHRQPALPHSRLVTTFCVSSVLP